MPINCSFWVISPMDWGDPRLERRAILQPFELRIEFSRRENRGLGESMSCAVEHSTLAAEMARSHRCWVQITDSLFIIFLKNKHRYQSWMNIRALWAASWSQIPRQNCNILACWEGRCPPIIIYYESCAAEASYSENWILDLMERK